MAKKINLNGVKDFFFNHGEKVALGTCIALALGFGVSGLLDARSAGKSESGRPWADELRDRHTQIATSLSDTTVPKLPKTTEELLNPDLYAWNPVTSKYAPLPYVNVGEREDSKRQNPRPLLIRSEPNKTVVLHYVPALVLMHELSKAKPAVKTLEVTGGGGGGGAPLIGPKKGPRGPAPAAGAGQGNIKFLQAGDPRRMVIGHAVIPMRALVAEFQQALKFTSQKEMFDQPREDLPVPLGFSLAKFEFLPNGQPATKEPITLVRWVEQGKEPIINDKLKKFLSLAVFDEKSAAALEPYIWEGLTMPLPRLAYGDYPPVTLEGIVSLPDDTPEEGGGVPQKKTPNSGTKLPGFGPGRQQPGTRPGMDKEGAKDEGPTYEESTRLRKELRAEGYEALDSRLFEQKFNIYHALGQKKPEGEPVNNNQPPGPRGQNAQGAQDRYFSAWDVKFPGDDDPDKQPGGLKKPLGPRQGPGGAADPKEAPFKNWDRDAVLRFIDIDVEPGHKYQYYIRIHFKNPNHKKRQLVAFDNLANAPEMDPMWIQTHSITIPNEYNLYALDQQPETGKAPAITGPGAKDATTFQVHKWEGTPPPTMGGENYPIGDWIVAERVIVHKGGKIGMDVSVKTPFWSELHDRFILKKQKGAKKDGLIRLSLTPPMVPNTGLLGDSGFPVLVDFVGGKKRYSASGPEEECAVDALILGANGKLRVLNSRDAGDPRVDSGKIRQERLQRARDRAAEVSGTPSDKKGTTKGLPGVGN